MRNFAEDLNRIRQDHQALIQNIKAESNSPSITTAHDTQAQRLSRAESVAPVVSVALDQELENLTDEIRAELAKAKPNYQEEGLTNDEIDTAIDSALQNNEKAYPIGSKERTDMMFKMQEIMQGSLEQDGVKISDNKKPGLS